MPSSASLRKQIESAFEHRYPSVLTPAAKTIREVAPTGIAQIDDILNGGLPVGAISELTGPASSGKTSIAIAALSRRIQEGGVCAWVDANDAFDPESAAANGISLNRLLWVRCNPGHDLTRLSARLTCCSSQVDSHQSCSTLLMNPSSMDDAFRLRPGFDIGRPQIALDAASSYLAKCRTHNQVPLSFLSVSKLPSIPLTIK
jgi:hypothetical protein